MDPNLGAILNNASALILTINKDGIVIDATGRGIEGLKLVPDRLLGRDLSHSHEKWKVSKRHSDVHWTGTLAESK
jgi:hypothetical protein